MPLPRIKGASITYQPWTGSPERPQFLKPVYRVEYETDAQQQNIVEFLADDAMETRQIASRLLNIPFSM